MEELIKKLKSGLLLDLTKEEMKDIENNSELKELFFEKVKEGYLFDVDNLPESFESILYSQEYISFFMEAVKKLDMIYFLKLFNMSPKDFEEIVKEEFEAVYKYYEDNKEEILKLFLENHNTLLNLKYFSIENLDYIKAIIDNNISGFIPKIKTQSVSKELEDFVIENVDSVNDSLKVYTDRIFETFKSKGKAVLLIDFIERNALIGETILEEFKQGKISFDSLTSKFKELYSDNNEFILACLKQGIVENTIPRQLVLDNPETVGIIAKLILEEKINSNYIVNEIIDIPEIYAALIEKRMHIGDSYNDINELTLSEECRSIRLQQILSKNPKLISDAISNFSDKYIDKSYNILKYIAGIDDEALSQVIQKLISRLSFSHYLIIIKSENKQIIDLITKYENKLNFDFTEIPENLDLRKIPHDSVKLRIINKLSEKQIMDCYHSFNQKEDKKIQIAFMRRLVELKASPDNYFSLLTRFKLYKIPEFQEIIFDTSNPLGLSIRQILYLDGLTLKSYDTQKIVELIKNSEHISAEDFGLIFNRAFEVKLKNLDPSFPDDSATIICNLEILNALLNIPDKIEDNIEVFKTLKAKVAELYGNTSVGSIEAMPVIKTFLLSRKNVPLSLSKYFDEELRSTSTYNLNVLKNNPLILDDVYPADLIIFIKVAIKNNEPINALILHKFADKYDESAFSYENVFYDTLSQTNALLNRCAYELNRSNQKIFFKNFIKSVDNKTVLSTLLVPSFKNAIIDEEILNIIIDKEKNENNLYSIEIVEALGNNYSQDTKNKLTSFIINKIKDKNISNNFALSKQLVNIENKEISDFVLDRFKNNCWSYDSWITTEETLGAVISKEEFLNVALDFFNKNSNSFMKYFKYIIKFHTLRNQFIENIKNIKIDKEFFTQEIFDLDILKAILENNIENINILLDYLIHNVQNAKFINDDSFDYFVKKASNYLNFNENCFKKLFELYGKNTLLILNDENIIKLLNKDISIVERYVEIFKVRKLDFNTIVSINDSIQQAIYTNKHKDEIDLFPETMEKISNGITEEDIENFIKLVYNYLPEKLELKDPELNELYKNNKVGFIKLLFEKIKQDQTTYAPILNHITTNFIKLKRIEVNRNEDIYTDTDAQFLYDKKQLYEAYFNYFVDCYPNILLRELHIEVNSNEYYALRYVMNPKNFEKKFNFTKEEIQEIRKCIFKLKEKFFEFLDNEYESFTIERYKNSISPEYLKNVKKILVINEREPNINDLSKINFDTLFELLENDTEFNIMIETLDKLKPLEWGNIFNRPIGELSLGENKINAYSFINSFNAIYNSLLNKEKKKRETIINETVKDMKEKGLSQNEIDEYIKKKEQEPYKINLSAHTLIRYCSLFSSLNNAYKIILGLEDFGLVRDNPGDNAARKGTDIDRLNFNSTLMLKMIQFNEVTIPSFVKNCTFEDKEKQPLQALVGCKGDSRNLTLGERTGACMRAYGHADDLFEFTNTDPRGFHIVFTDPETGEFISRVSGFRNGNTVFLNELRHSKNPSKYSDEDVIEACKDIAKELIERSKDSDMPIENVVCHNEYCLRGYPTKQLSSYFISDGIYSGYRDVNQNAVIMATIGENGNPVDLKPNPNQPMYKSVRLPVKAYTRDNITQSVKVLIQRIDAIKECLEHSDNEDYYLSIDFNFDILDTEYEYVIIGQDFYVTLDTKGNIKHNIACETEDSLKEYNEAIEKVDLIKKNKFNLGGNSNGKQ